MNKPTLTEFLARMEAECENPTPFHFVGSVGVKALVKMLVRIRYILEAHTHDAHETAGIRDSEGNRDAAGIWTARGTEVQSILVEFHEELSALIPRE